MYVAIKSIENSRQMRYQSLNAYRKRFNMKAYTSFEDMTGEKKLNFIHKLYLTNIFRVEYFPSLYICAMKGNQCSVNSNVTN